MQIGEIVGKAATALNDPDGARWPTSELIEYLTSALFALSALRPVAFETTATLTLVAGAKQAIPDTALQLLTVTRNINANDTTGAAILPMSKSALDLHSPSWWTDTESGTIENFAYDPTKNLEVFYVYPPAVVGTKIEASYVLDVVPLTDSMEPLPVPDFYEPVLLDYVLGRAYAKNSELGEVPKAQAHFEAFYTGLGMQVKVAKQMAAKAVEGA